MESENTWKIAALGLAALAGTYIVYRAIKSHNSGTDAKNDSKGPSAVELGNKFVYIGCYTEKLGHILGDKIGKGVYTFKLNDDGSLTQ